VITTLFSYPVLGEEVRSAVVEALPWALGSPRRRDASVVVEDVGGLGAVRLGAAASAATRDATRRRREEPARRRACTQVGWKDAPTVVMGLLGMLLIVRPPAIFTPLGHAAPWLGVPPDEASGSHTTQGPRWVGVGMQLGEQPAPSRPHRRRGLVWCAHDSSRSRSLSSLASAGFMR
jgi:hypothetical protein